MTDAEKAEIERMVQRAIVCTIDACRATNKLVQNTKKQTVMDSVTRIKEILSGRAIELPDEYRYLKKWSVQ